MSELFDKSIRTLELPRVLQLLSEQAVSPEAKELARRILDSWDYSDLMLAVEGLLANLMFSGTPDEVEAKLERFPAAETQKNVMRGFLGLPPRVIPDVTGN